MKKSFFVMVFLFLTVFVMAASEPTAPHEVIADLAEGDLELWGGTDECNKEMEYMLREYWEVTDFSKYPGCETAWSAAFISRMMWDAGVRFPGDGLHSDYFNAIKNNPDKYDCTTYANTAENFNNLHPLRLGDIVCSCRSSTQCKAEELTENESNSGNRYCCYTDSDDVVQKSLCCDDTYDKFTDSGHCDIVTDVSDPNKIKLVGGNVGDTVKEKTRWRSSFTKWPYVGYIQCEVKEHNLFYSQCRIAEKLGKSVKVTIEQPERFPKQDTPIEMLFVFASGVKSDMEIIDGKLDSNDFVLQFISEGDEEEGMSSEGGYMWLYTAGVEKIRILYGNEVWYKDEIKEILECASDRGQFRNDPCSALEEFTDLMERYYRQGGIEECGMAVG